MSVKYGLEPQIIQKIIAVFEKFPEIKEVILYGSRAKESHRIGSDIDITLKGTQLNHQALNDIIWQLDDLLLPYTFDVSLFHQISNPDLIGHINRLGKILYTNKEDKVKSR